MSLGHHSTLKDFSRSAGGSDPGFFQIIVSAMGPRASEILCVPFKNEGSISHSRLSITKANPAGLQSHVF